MPKRVSGAGVLETDFETDSDAEYLDSVSIFIIRNADSVSKFASSGMLLGNSDHAECDACLEVKREDNQNCSLLCCVRLLCTNDCLA